LRAKASERVAHGKPMDGLRTLTLARGVAQAASSSGLCRRIA
jgi:hypothetical protein